MRVLVVCVDCARGSVCKAKLQSEASKPKPSFHRPAAGQASSQAFTGLRPAKPQARLSPACGRPSLKPGFHRPAAGRSEEHTSALQSLMRNSYAVLCLKKKKTPQTPETEQQLR